MQIVKSDHNSELKKDEETHLRKMNSHRSMARKPKSDPQFRAPFRWEGVVGNIMAGRHHGYPDGGPKLRKGSKNERRFSKKAKLWEGEEEGRDRERKRKREREQEKEKRNKGSFLQKHLGYKQNF